ncbi:hypothetical protein OPT61_g8112 [Boeremia exigua]|uniref:Uncharacterized protein n=1 Tax=Boeremia exigua TaxID=749465 RepID=A0ACC2HZJ6_9PLEO|nr:hypothetical protein OPT61_g8112 [Boeremia exigua]
MTASTPTGHCRAQRHALQYHSTSTPKMIVPETVLSEAQEYDWAACYNEVERWNTPEPEAIHEEEKDKSSSIRVFKGAATTDGAKLWCLKDERDGVCLGCGGKRVAAAS